MAVIASICLALCGLSHGLLQETALTVLYALSCCGFAMVLRRLVPKIGILAILTPLLCIILLVTCPVFFDLGMLRPFQRIFPLGWYLQDSLGGLSLYAFGAFGFCAVADHLPGIGKQ